MRELVVNEDCGKDCASAARSYYFYAMRLNAHTAIVGDTVVLVPYRHVIRSEIRFILTCLPQCRACRGTAVSISVPHSAYIQFTHPRLALAQNTT